MDHRVVWPEMPVPSIAMAEGIKEGTRVKKEGNVATILIMGHGRENYRHAFAKSSSAIIYY